MITRDLTSRSATMRAGEQETVTYDTPNESATEKRGKSSMTKRHNESESY